MPSKAQKAKADATLAEAFPETIHAAKIKQQRIMIQLDLEYLRTDVRICAQYLADKIRGAVEAGFATPDLDRVKAEFERLDFTSTIARLQGLAKQWKAQDKALETLKAALGGDDGELSLIVQERVQLQHQAIECLDCLKAMAKNRTKLLRAAPPVRTDTPPRTVPTTCHLASTPHADTVPSVAPRDSDSPAISPIQLRSQAASPIASPAISPIPPRSQATMDTTSPAMATSPILPRPQPRGDPGDAEKGKVASRVGRKRQRLEEPQASAAPMAQPRHKPQVPKALPAERPPKQPVADENKPAAPRAHRTDEAHNTSASALDTSSNKGKKRKLFANKFSMAFLEQAKKTTDPSQRILGNLTLGAILAAKK